MESTVTYKSDDNSDKLTSTQKRRLRRKKQSIKSASDRSIISQIPSSSTQPSDRKLSSIELTDSTRQKSIGSSQSIDTNILQTETVVVDNTQKPINMLSNDKKSREEVKAAREAKKLAKQKVKQKSTPKPAIETKESGTSPPNNQKDKQTCTNLKEKENKDMCTQKSQVVITKDEVDRAVQITSSLDDITVNKPQEILSLKEVKNLSIKDSEFELTNKSVVETLDTIVDIAKKMQEVSGKVDAIRHRDEVKKEESVKSKSELKAERRAKQEAQRAAKELAAKQKEEPTKKAEKVNVTPILKQEAKPVVKLEKPKVKAADHKVHWFQHLYAEREVDVLKKIGVNNNLNPAIIKLGVQLRSRVVTGANARSLALLNALKQVVKDYSLPAKTEFARGLESYLSTCLTFLWSMRKPSASQTNAIKYFRYQLTQLPNNVNEFDAKQTLQDAIDTYIRDQIEVAGKAISITVRKKIAVGDNILTYDCSSLIERVLTEAWCDGVKFHTCVVGSGSSDGGREMLRRLTSQGLPCTYLDISALGFAMRLMNKVIVGASSLLVNGSVVGRAGTAQVALAARAHNVPVLVCCERHKVSERVQTDAFVHNEIGDPDDLIDKSDESSPLKDWRSNPNLTLLNLTYDVTPPSLVTAVVTDLAILPCSSAPVVLRFMQSEYGF